MKNFILFVGLKKYKKTKTKNSNNNKKNLFTFNPVVEKAANYAEIGRAGKLEVDYQQVLLVKIFWNFHNIVMKHGH